MHQHQEHGQVHQQQEHGHLQQQYEQERVQQHPRSCNTLMHQAKSGGIPVLKSRTLMYAPYLMEHLGSCTTLMHPHELNIKHIMTIHIHIQKLYSIAFAFAAYSLNDIFSKFRIYDVVCNLQNSIESLASKWHFLRHTLILIMVRTWVDSP